MIKAITGLGRKRIQNGRYLAESGRNLADKTADISSVKIINIKISTLAPLFRMDGPIPGMGQRGKVGTPQCDS